MSGRHAIHVKELTKTYSEGFWLKKKKVLHELSFSVPEGEIFGFLGANGAGKTTTIKIALGLQSADSGSVSVLGFDSRDIRSKENIGYLPERPYFQGNLSANEFLNFHRGLFGRSRKAPSNAELLSLVGLPGIGPHLLSGFSKGMLQRLGIAQCLVNDPRMLILDEPMSGLDPIGRKEMRNLILDLSQRGKTVFFSSHILGDIEALCRQIAFLEKGRLKYCGLVADLVRPSSQEYEIVFRPPSGKMPPALLAITGDPRMSGDRFRLQVSGAKRAREVIEACWAHGAEVQSFSPVQKSLEDVLFGREEKSL